MICLILAAGYAAWLYPLTENYPEPLWRRTVLDRLLSDVDGVDVVMKYRQVANG
jgi:NDP-sugar pyrophosphorylase family protein